MTNTHLQVYLAALLCGLAVLSVPLFWALGFPFADSHHHHQQQQQQQKQQKQHQQHHRTPHWKANICAAHRAITLAEVALDNAPSAVILHNHNHNHNHNHPDKKRRNAIPNDIFTILDLPPSREYHDRTIREAWRSGVASLMGTVSCIRDNNNNYNSEYTHDGDDDGRDGRHQNQPKNQQSDSASGPPSLCTLQFDALTLSARAVADPLARQWWIDYIVFEKDEAKRDVVVGLLCG